MSRLPRHRLPTPRLPTRGHTLLPFYALLIAAALFIGITGQTLPDIVASHFNGDGQVDGFMPRSVYLSFMFTLIILVPLLLATFPRRAFRRPDADINIPNRDYWLAPTRRAATVAFLSRQPPRFAALLLVFLCYAHWLVVRANQQPLPHLPEFEMLAGLAVFLVAAAVWAISFLRYFRRIPRTDNPPRQS